MNFKEQLEQLSQQVAERKSHIVNEEMTKQSLIIPFIQLLGYDIFNPLEVRPEYSADFAKKKGARVDYAIFNENDASIFIEAKTVSESLEKYNSQLAYYFNATHQLKLAILTNGVEYYFFTDLNVTNVMDESPFLRFNILSITDECLKILEQIRKQNFNTKLISALAEELVYKKDLDAAIYRLLKDPNNDFIRFVIKDVFPTRITATVIDKFRPMVKKSILDSIEAIYHEKNEEASKQTNDLKTPTSLTRNRNKKPTVAQITDEEIISPDSVKITKPTEPAIDEVAVTVEEQTIGQSSIEPSETDMEVYQCVKNILSLEKFDTAELGFHAASDCFNIYFNNTADFILKLYFTESASYIVIPLPIDDIAKRIGNLLRYEQASNPNSTKIHIDNVQDIYKLARLIIQRVKALQAINTSI